MDLGVSCIPTGRKPEAVVQKIRNDVLFFIESHAATHDHAVVLLVSDTSKFSGELRALGRAGILTFVMSADPPTSITPTVRCYYAGQWHQIMSNARNAMPSSPAVDEQKIASQWAAISEGSTLDEDAVAAAIREAVGPLAWKPIATAQNTPRRPTQLSAISSSGIATNETKGDDNEETMWHPMMSLRRTRSSSRKSTNLTLPFPRLDAESDNNAQTTGASLAQALTEPTHNNNNNINQNSLLGGGGSATNGTAADRRAAWTTPGKSKPTTTTTGANANVDGSFDPYRILFGKLQRNSEECISIAERDSASKHELQKSQLDFDYCWLKQLPIAKGSGIAVCCRLHKSGRVTDIRLCGQVARVVRGEFGFIKHEFFPGNLYFRTADVDPSGGASGSTALSEGSIVAFRIGRKGERVWALRVWKTPEGVLDSLMTTTSAPRPFGTSRNTNNTHNNNRHTKSKKPRHRRNNSRGHNSTNKRSHRFNATVAAR